MGRRDLLLTLPILNGLGEAGFRGQKIEVIDATFKSLLRETTTARIGGLTEERHWFAQTHIIN